MKEKISKYTINRRSLEGKIKDIYRHQKSHSKTRKHNPPTYSKEEFLDYCLNSETFQTLYKNWVDSGFEKDLAPSIDRLDDSKGYSFENIRVCTWKENHLKQKQNVKNGIDLRQLKPVLQFDLEGNFIKEYYSINQCCRNLSIHRSNLINCLKGLRNKTGGFKFKYKINESN